MQLGTTGISPSHILRDITNRHEAPSAPDFNKFNHDVEGPNSARQHQIVDTPDQVQVELDNALELKKNGSHEEAFSSFQLLAAKNNRRAQFELGEMYFNGEFVPQDYVIAMDFYSAAANVEDAKDSYQDAFNKIGYLYEKGLGTAPNARQAAWHYRQGALRGNDEACCNLAYLYEHGIGVHTSNAAAVFWYSRAGIDFG
jgi:TPR repeat protein